MDWQTSPSDNRAASAPRATVETLLDASSLSAAMRAAAELTEGTLDQLLPLPAGPEAKLYEAMRYASLGGGKRLRPFLVLASGALFAAEEIGTRRAAAAIELIHCYSLIHDDLPCMDDDDLRRGRPTAHKAFDEATAVLAGDGLLTLAFDVLAAPETDADPAIRVALVAELARAAGAHGMVGGQALDLAAENGVEPFALSEVTRLQQWKTGALIAAACQMGAVLGRADEAARRALKAYGQDLGLAFQIADDLLDVEGETATVGKAVGKDAAQGKATFVSLLGVEEARRKANALVGQAERHLAPFGAKARMLGELAAFVVYRSS
jgi:farnesyl diphosphate synthase